MNEPYDYEPQFAEPPHPQEKRYVTYIPYGLTPEAFEERKKVKKLANTIGFALLVVLAVSELLGIVLRIVLGLFDLWNVKTIAYISDPAFNQVFNALFSALVFTVPFALAFKISGVRVSGLIKFKKPKREDILPYSLLGIAFCAFANITVSYMGNFFSMFGFNYDVDFGENPQGFFGFMLTFIAVAIIPPLSEEFACRGIMLGALKKYGNGFAVLCSAIVFGIMHGNFQQMPFAFLVGLALGFVTVKTGSIWIAVGIHAFNNAFSVIYDYATLDFSQESKNIAFVIYLIICMLAGIFGVFLLSKRDGAYSIKDKKSIDKTYKVYSWFFSSPTIIIFMVICGLKALQYFV